MSIREKHKFKGDNLTQEKKARLLILHNDDVHTFDYVIDALIDICQHDTIQAEQCTMIIHFKGKCSVKEGRYEQLRSMKEAFINMELDATID